MESLDFAFLFPFFAGNRPVAVWAHQRVLAIHGNFQSTFNIPNVFAPGPAPGRLHEIPGDSLVAYCALIHYMYTGHAQLEVDLRKFTIHPWPYPSPEEYQVRGNVVDHLLVRPLRTVSWMELYQLALRYELNDLRDQCVYRLQEEARAHEGFIM